MQFYVVSEPVIAATRKPHLGTGLTDGDCHCCHARHLHSPERERSPTRTIVRVQKLSGIMAQATGVTTFP